jgi:hypothetical protein
VNRSAASDTVQLAGTAFNAGAKAPFRHRADHRTGFAETLRDAFAAPKEPPAPLTPQQLADLVRRHGNRYSDLD